MSARSAQSDGMLAALPISAALVLLLARWLPVRFAYVPNELGIVSLATLERYPQQQETFWLLFSVGAGTLLAWWLARWLRAERMPAGAQAGVEALGAVARRMAEENVHRIIVVDQRRHVVGIVKADPRRAALPGVLTIRPRAQRTGRT